jgi:hypothetical protein
VVVVVDVQAKAQIAQALMVVLVVAVVSGITVQILLAVLEHLDKVITEVAALAERPITLAVAVVVQMRQVARSLVLRVVLEVMDYLLAFLEHL